MRADTTELVRRIRQQAYLSTLGGLLYTSQPHNEFAILRRDGLWFAGRSGWTPDIGDARILTDGAARCAAETLGAERVVVCACCAGRSQDARCVPAVASYQMLTAPGERGRIAVCAEHAEVMRRWAGKIEERRQ